ncbi:MAG: DUF4097 family beta strand repeat-containing protein [Bryobacteraceae bacterium]
MKSAYLRYALATACLTMIGATAGAQMKDNAEKELNCSHRWHNDGSESYCEMKELSAPVTGHLSVDGGTNGGAAVRGWNRNEILVRAQIQTWAVTDSEAKALAGQIRIETAGSRIQATGPRSEGKAGWGVSFEIFVPHRTGVSAKTHNGGVSLSDLRGEIEFEALNGGVSLKRLAGAVHGRTTNGGLNIELAGDRWDGDRLEAATTNGGVHLEVPSDYSARLETGTVNGEVRVDFPVTVRREIGRNFATTLGKGGPTVRVTTTNGGVRISRKS